jgi:hypothetical protein
MTYRAHTYDMSPPTTRRYIEIFALELCIHEVHDTGKYRSQVVASE